MKLSDFVIDFLAKEGIHHAFLVSGGAVIHLVDSASKHPRMMCVCSQHEQNGAASADMYARVTGNLGLVMSTSGPGATNMVTSICNAYFDSIPMICLTGQVARFRIRKTPTLRQRGFQETDVVSIFQSITKYVKLVTDPLKIRYELEKAIYFAKEGRPGPVVLDIPDDLQREEINPATLVGFDPPVLKKDSKTLHSSLQKLISLITAAERPVLILGAGVHCAQVEKEALDFAREHHLPIALTWGGADLLAEKDELNIGRIGVCGPRGGNFAVQHSDLIIAMGTRLSQMVTGGKQNLFAPKALKVMIDVDEEELKKFDASTFILDLPIHADLRDFFENYANMDKSVSSDRFSDWRTQIQDWRARYPICIPEDSFAASRVNPYVFLKHLSKMAHRDAIIIGDTGANVSWLCQAFEFKKGQRCFSAWNHTPMGYSLPASVGAALATDKEIICLIGDGGLMMCLQELATIRRHHLPVKIFIFDNQGHGIQKQTIDTWLNSHYVAVDQASGLYFPDYQKIAEAFSLPFYSLKNHQEIEKNLETIWKNTGPWICNVEIIQDQKIVPMLKFGAGLEDLHPKLDVKKIEQIAEEALGNIISHEELANQNF